MRAAVLPTTSPAGEDSYIVRAFDSLIDELAVYSRTLVASEIQAIYNAASP